MVFLVKAVLIKKKNSFFCCFKVAYKNSNQGEVARGLSEIRRNDIGNIDISWLVCQEEGKNISLGEDNYWGSREGFVVHCFVVSYLSKIQAN